VSGGHRPQDNGQLVDTVRFEAHKPMHGIGSEEESEREQ